MANFTGTPFKAPALTPRDARHFDSPALEDRFLAAIGFQAPETNRRANTQAGPSPRPERTGPGASPELSHPPGDDSRGKGDVTSSQWTRTKTQPAPLSNTYWDAQRIANGIANPASYPQRSRHGGGAASSGWPNDRVNAPWARHQVARQQETTLEESPSAENWEVAPRPSLPPVPTNTDHWIKLPDSRHRGRGEGASKPKNDITGRPQGPSVAHLQIGQLSPDLTAHHMPRPDRNYAGSTYSLPSLGSGINVSNSGMCGRSTADQSSVDIRNTIGLQPNIHKAGDSWTTYNWADPYGRDNDDTLCSANYLAAFITAWIKQIPDSAPASFNQGVPEHWRCDIDTVTGRFFQPICQPESIIDHSNNIDQHLEWRRQNWTSTLLMRRSMGPRGHGPGHKGHWNPRSRCPAALDERLIVAVHEPVIEKPEYQHFVPRTPCYLRPAAKHDMQGVCRIYNLEMERGLQALDTEPLTGEDFEHILTTAQKLGMPFIVAMSGSARELGLTKGNLAFSAFRQMPSHGPDNFGEVLGFAFLSTWQSGLTGQGTANGSSRATTRINVFVHPEYRLKKVGFSLLDMLLTTVSDRFSSESGYDFIDPTNSPVYKNSRGRERQYFRLYISYRVKSKQRAEGNPKLEKEQEAYDNDLTWVKKMLVDKLNFVELVRFENVHRTAKGRAEAVCWLDEVVFEHTCLFDPLIVKADY
ncbi:hypothetical protein C8A05DRAFT_13066 [Staphylotrichum tortipilum]|uniref:Uncharacterized protein n=1 Tax=Staphylotrichum tortipilum TaxID=2831512 RepID=A0AAN6MRF6_9PEZI|nr:hypothetical protein C8A05DRAFT_13066 [Staphylotrichum longicolle]